MDIAVLFRRAGTTVPARRFFRARRPAVLVLAACLFSFAGGLKGQAASSVYQEIRQLAGEGRYAEAERKLDEHLAQNPSDATALGLKGLVLDFEGRYDEAERSYKKALEFAPGSLFVLNNLGRHYVALKRAAEARDAFQRVLARDRANAFALMELATLSVDAGHGGEALAYLDRIAGAAAPEAQILRARALHLTSVDAAASKLLDQLEAPAAARAPLYFQAGLLLAQWGRYREAQRAFSRALEADPSSANIQYNLGLASAQAGDLDRAREIFEHALMLRPGDVDSMLQLALVHQRQGNYEQSLPILIRASGLAPKRHEILRNIAYAAERLGMYGDTAQAWNRYLQLQPGDDVARRERGFALASANDLERGLADLTWFHQKHPENVDGLYELAIAEGVAQPEAALEHLNQALRLKPDLAAAHYARASLYYSQGKAEQAREDIEFVMKAAPENARALDLAGRVESQTGHTERAAALFERALKIAPRDAQLLLHYSQALQALGRTAEAKEMGERYRVVGRQRGQSPSESWAFNFYERSPEEQRARYIASLRGRIRESPDDASLHLLLGEALLGDAGTSEAVDELRQAARLSGDPQVSACCGRVLLRAGQPAAAAELLRAAAGGTPPDDLVYDLAVAEFHRAGMAAAQNALARIPESRRGAEYFILEAEVLSASRRPGDALASLRRAQAAGLPAKSRPEFYLEWATLLLIHDRPADALEILRRAGKTASGNRELLLGEAVALARSGDVTAGAVVERVEKQWPEWERLHLVKGAILAKQGSGRAALEALRVSSRTDPVTAGAACYVAAAVVNGKPEIAGQVRNVTESLVNTDPDDPFCGLLAGIDASAARNYDEALRVLAPLAAAHPRWKELRIALRDVYLAMGRAGDAAREEAAAAAALGGPAPSLDGALAASAMMGARLRIPAALTDAL